MANKTNNKTTVSTEVKKEKRVNPTWEAFGKYKGAFVVLDPSILD